MSRIKYILWTIVCMIGSFLTPLWLTIAYLNITGLIYEYDYTMDQGTAGIFGIILLFTWIMLVLLPVILLLKKIRQFGNRKPAYLTVVFVLSALLCMVAFNWNIAEFWIG